MVIPLSSLRHDIYRLVDRVLETGEPLEITRKGRTLRIVPDAPVDRLARITPIAGLIVGDPDELVSIDWSGAWDAEANA
ncbi:MAG: type II toxin-antitoxin system prevent-host-death family antitoxin [Protaetiibacter sp.]